MSFLELLQQGGVTLIPLGLCSVLVVAVVLERIWAFTRIGSVPRELIRRVEGLITRGDWNGATRLLDESASPFARVARSSVLLTNPSHDEVLDTLTLASDAELAAMQKPLPILGTIGNIAPFIGLLGTVFGIIKAFQDVANNTMIGKNGLSAGISEALIATAAGLAIGITAVIFFNWFNAQLEQFRMQLERFSTEWSYALRRLRDEATEAEPVA
jgi:biopolymer transport protein ExbB